MTDDRTPRNSPMRPCGRSSYRPNSRAAEDPDGFEGAAGEGEEGSEVEDSGAASGAGAGVDSEADPEPRSIPNSLWVCSGDAFGAGAARAVFLSGCGRWRAVSCGASVRSTGAGVGKSGVVAAGASGGGWGTGSSTWREFNGRCGRCALFNPGATTLAAPTQTRATMPAPHTPAARPTPLPAVAAPASESGDSDRARSARRRVVADASSEPIATASLKGLSTESSSREPGPPLAAR